MNGVFKNHNGMWEWIWGDVRAAHCFVAKEAARQDLAKWRKENDE
jgi:hypothetical protein